MRGRPSLGYDWGKNKAVGAPLWNVIDNDPVLLCALLCILPVDSRRWHTRKHNVTVVS